MFVIVVVQLTRTCLERAFIVLLPFIIITLYKLFVSCILRDMKHYTVQQFEDQFPSNDACLDYIFRARFGSTMDCRKCGVISSVFYRVKGRKCYACEWCGYQVSPLAGTIFHCFHVPLKTWFRAIYSFSIAKNGVSAKEIQRAYGITYETALRMAHHIRQLMVQDSDQLTGVVEADETYIGGRRKLKREVR